MKQLNEGTHFSNLGGRIKLVGSLQSGQERYLLLNTTDKVVGRPPMRWRDDMDSYGCRSSRDSNHWRKEAGEEVVLMFRNTECCFASCKWEAMDCFSPKFLGRVSDWQFQIRFNAARNSSWFSKLALFLTADGRLDCLTAGRTVHQTLLQRFCGYYNNEVQLAV